MAAPDKFFASLATLRVLASKFIFKETKLTDAEEQIRNVEMATLFEAGHESHLTNREITVILLQGLNNAGV